MTDRATGRQHRSFRPRPAPRRPAGRPGGRRRCDQGGGNRRAESPRRLLLDPAFRLRHAPRSSPDLRPGVPAVLAHPCPDARRDLAGGRRRGRRAGRGHAAGRPPRRGSDAGRHRGRRGEAEIRDRDRRPADRVGGRGAAPARLRADGRGRDRQAEREIDRLRLPDDRVPSRRAVAATPVARSIRAARSARAFAPAAT